MKTPLIYSASFFYLGEGLVPCFGGLNPPKPPGGDGLVHSRTDVYEVYVISASLHSAYFFWCWRVSAVRSIETVYTSTNWIGIITELM